MSSQHRFSNKFNKTGAKVCLYGKISYKAVAYCKLHKCYLDPLNIREKKCEFKKCKYLYKI